MRRLGRWKGLSKIVHSMRRFGDGKDYLESKTQHWGVYGKDDFWRQDDDIKEFLEMSLLECFLFFFRGVGVWETKRLLPIEKEEAKVLREKAIHDIAKFFRRKVKVLKGKKVRYDIVRKRASFHLFLEKRYVLFNFLHTLLMIISSSLFSLSILFRYGNYIWLVWKHKPHRLMVSIDWMIWFFMFGTYFTPCFS